MLLGAEDGIITILRMHFDSGTIGGLRHPKVQVFSLPCLEEECVVTIV